MKESLLKGTFIFIENGQGRASPLFLEKHPHFFKLGIIETTFNSATEYSKEIKMMSILSGRCLCAKPQLPYLQELLEFLNLEEVSSIRNKIK